MLKKLNTYLITNYPSIWRSKIVYILPVVLLLSLITPFNQISTDKSLKKLENIGRKISALEDKLHKTQYKIEVKYPELETIFNNTWDIQQALRARRQEKLSVYKREGFNYYLNISNEVKRLKKTYSKQIQKIAKKKYGGVRVYLNNLEKMEKLEIKEYNLAKSLKVIIDTEKRVTDIIYYSTFIWVLLIYVWLYIQYLSPVYLKNYSFFNIFRVNILSFLSIFSILIPLSLLVFFIGENLSKIGYTNLDYPHLNYSFEFRYYPRYYLVNLLNVGYLFLLPIVFISLFIRYYSFSEIIITILAGILCVFLTAILLGSQMVSFETFLMILHAPFLLILWYTCFRLDQKRYGKLIRVLILLILGTGHLFIAYIQAVFFFPEIERYSNMYHDYAYSFSIDYWITLYASTFIFMTLLTWYFARALQQPKVVR